MSITVPDDLDVAGVAHATVPGVVALTHTMPECRPHSIWNRIPGLSGGDGRRGCERLADRMEDVRPVDDAQEGAVGIDHAEHLAGVLHHGASGIRDGHLRAARDGRPRDELRCGHLAASGAPGRAHEATDDARVEGRIDDAKDVGVTDDPHDPSLGVEDHGTVEPGRGDRVDHAGEVGIGSARPGRRPA